MISITMLFTLLLFDGTILNYIGKENKIMILEEIGDSIQSWQDIKVTTGRSSERLVAYHELRFSNVDYNRCEVDYFVRKNGFKNCSILCNIYEIIRELGQFCFQTEFIRSNQSRKNMNNRIRREELEFQFGTKQPRNVL